ncbi:MAG TPA: LiaF domain-containing protein [Chloroflexota bacterium]|nr:LiaF domain-containing protein [Chloroflexota bacterium]
MSATFPHTRSGPNFDRLIIGGVLIALGVLILLQQSGYAAAGQVIGGWWPLVIVLLGASHLLTNRGAAIGPVIVMVIGLALLAGTLELVPGGTLALVWPLILMAIGASILLHRSSADIATTTDQNNLDLSVGFSGITHISRSQQFRTARLNATCGGIVLDLRQAKLDPAGATVTAKTTCGGIEIRVPDGWQVEMTGTPIFGGYDMKDLEADVVAPGAPRLKIDVSALFGGVTVKH